MNCFSLMGQALNCMYNDYTLSDKSINIFTFINGTTVHARTLSEAKNIMSYTFSNFKGEYWANEVEENIWEVQYTPVDIPSLYITVEADGGNSAAYNGYAILEKDLKEMKLIRNNLIK